MKQRVCGGEHGLEAISSAGRADTLRRQGSNSADPLAVTPHITLHTRFHLYRPPPSPAARPLRSACLSALAPRNGCANRLTHTLDPACRHPANDRRARSAANARLATATPPAGNLSQQSSSPSLVGSRADWIAVAALCTEDAQVGNAPQAPRCPLL